MGGGELGFDVASLSGGGFVVAWTDPEGPALHVRRFDAAYQPISAESEQPWQARLGILPSPVAHPSVDANGHHIVVIWDQDGETARIVGGGVLAY
jgi:hypothetical protein